MNRGTTIAAIAVATGALVGASVISVVAIGSSASSAEPIVGNTVVPVTASGPQPSTGSISADDLKLGGSDSDLVVPTVVTPPATVPATGSTRTIATRPAAKPTRPAFSAAQAKALVLKAAPGRVEGVSATRRGGYSAYAVKVQRTNGSVVIGYVDRASGIVFDWTQVSSPTSSGSTGASSRGSSTASHDDSQDDYASDDQYGDDGQPNDSQSESGDHESDGHGSGLHGSDGSDD